MKLRLPASVSIARGIVLASAVLAALVIAAFLTDVSPLVRARTEAHSSGSMRFTVPCHQPLDLA